MASVVDDPNGKPDDDDLLLLRPVHEVVDAIADMIGREAARRFLDRKTSDPSEPIPRIAPA
jgi:hypothetical protein